MKTQIILHPDDRVSMRIEFEFTDFHGMIRDKLLNTPSEIYYEWCELKTKTIHDLVCEPLYEHHVFSIRIIDHPYELWNEFTVLSDDHVRDIMQCRYCSLDETVNYY